MKGVMTSERTSRIVHQKESPCPDNKYSSHDAHPIETSNANNQNIYLKKKLIFEKYSNFSIGHSSLVKIFTIFSRTLQERLNILML
jgi:hypothetical protein